MSAAHKTELIADFQAAFEKIRFHHPRTVRLHHEFEIMRKIARKTRFKMQRALPVIGPSSSGKSCAVDLYMKGLSIPEYDGEIGVRPVIYVELQPKSTPRRLYSDILRTFEGEKSKAGTEADMRERMYRYLIEARVELLIIDEFHHLIHREDKAPQYSVAASCKQLLNEGICAMAVLGLKRVEVITKDPEFASRTRPPIQFDPLNPLKTKDRQLFIGYIDELDEHLVSAGITGRKSNLAKPEICACLQDVSSGTIGHVSNLVRFAISGMVEREDDIITEDDLTLAVEEWAIPMGVCGRNAFVEGISSRSLEPIG
ncbi:TniB family NTP-binding protein [Dongia soli]|uniref:TniB family NTP-binding protein n=1 Tax=Dongia soli TaxID=600628 RepID=A0ABU5EGN7_9PROT|nr:TniB family NTP-binding protein [Dongia soli]MDY0885386.1 TniB family NTP-binding protein [Dongia soli]